MLTILTASLRDLGRCNQKKKPILANFVFITIGVILVYGFALDGFLSSSSSIHNNHASRHRLNFIAFTFTLSTGL